ncbi:MAG: hybrid sensor histidine kinase/response regulator [Anaerolineae bacterium]|nr:hybrid sensor histidine kinase/response regulator [Anaerolineae bacterium]
MNPCILVVEDDTAMAEGISDTLELASYDIMRAANGQDGLRQIARRKPDLILSDIMMGGMDGYEFCEAVQANQAWVDIPFVFLTAKHRPEEIRRGKQLGVDDYLTKPFLPEDLLVVVQAKIERAKVRHAVAQSEVATLKDQLATMISHELRTPLTYIQGYLEMVTMDRDTLTEEDLILCLNGIKVGSDRLGRLVQDMLTWLTLRTEGAAQDYRLSSRADGQLPALLHQVVSDFAETANARGVKIVLEVPLSLPPVRVCRGQIVDVLLRLLDNAVKFSLAEGGVVKVAATETPEGVLASVQDHGVGMPAHRLSHIFEPLHQVDRARHEQQGAGMGLAIARAYVELHGGRIWAESAPGQGSTFYFVLPKISDACSSALYPDQTPVTAASMHSSTVP